MSTIFTNINSFIKSASKHTQTKEKKLMMKIIKTTSNKIIYFFVKSWNWFSTSWFYRWFIKKWTDDLPRVALGLLAGFAFACFISWYNSRGTVNFVYDVPEVKFEKGIDDYHAPHKIEYIERIIVENKTDHPFDVSTEFSFFTEWNNENIPANWNPVFCGIIEDKDFTPQSDGYGKLKPHDYFKAKEVINIAPPPSMSMQKFKDELLKLPVTIQLSSTLNIKYPEADTHFFHNYLPFRDVITTAIQNKNSFYQN
jgi:hypothetical protein